MRLSGGEAQVEPLAEDVFGYFVPEVDVGLAGCEELLLGRVDFARPRPLFMFFF